VIITVWRVLSDPVVVEVTPLGDDVDPSAPFEPSADYRAPGDVPLEEVLEGLGLSRKPGVSVSAVRVDSERGVVFSRVTHETSVPVRRCRFDFRGNEIPLDEFTLTKLLYSRQAVGKTHL